MSVKFYRLEIAPSETDGEGEDHDEWFTSLRAARKRRAWLIAENPELEDHRYDRDFMIWAYTARASFPRRRLILVLLNGWSDWYEKREVVVAAYEPEPRSNGAPEDW